MLGGCASINEVPVQRATVGPRADSIYNARFVRGYARLPTFDETSKFRDDLDRPRRATTLTKNPAIATSPRASQFRFERRVDLGMTKQEVTLLLGAPDAMTADAERMKASAADLLAGDREAARRRCGRTPPAGRSTSTRTAWWTSP